jgi:hypothetical protein
MTDTVEVDVDVDVEDLATETVVVSGVLDVDCSNFLGTIDAIHLSRE